MKMFKKFIGILIVVAAANMITGCANKPLQEQGPKQNNTLQSIAKMKSIGAMIGCMFAPNDPECVKLRDKRTDDKPHLSQEEYDNQNNKEWDKIN
jgi:PBP1b-binding outer membrane lipoprotein LpoB